MSNKTPYAVLMASLALLIYLMNSSGSGGGDSDKIDKISKAKIAADVALKGASSYAYANGSPKPISQTGYRVPMDANAPALNYAEMMGATQGKLEFSLAEQFNNFSFRSLDAWKCDKNTKVANPKGNWNCNSGQEIELKEQARSDLAKCLALKDNFSDIVGVASIKHSLDPALIHAIIAQESCYNPNAESAFKAYGLMQLIAPTAHRFGVNPSTPDNIKVPATNVDAGSAYLKHLLKHFSKHNPTNQIAFAIASYNGGEGLDTYAKGRVPAFVETQKYVQNVVAGYNRQRMKIAQQQTQQMQMQRQIRK